MILLRTSLFALLALVVLPIAAFAGDIVLTVTSKADPSVKKQYDMQALEAIGMNRFVTTTSWTEGDVTFEGVKLADLLKDAKLSGTVLHASAINDYAVDIPASDADAYPVMIATKMNGERMAVRDKGPLWIVYPRADFPDLMDESHNFKWVWQLTAIEVQ